MPPRVTKGRFVGDERPAALERNLDELTHLGLGEVASGPRLWNDAGPVGFLGEARTQGLRCQVAYSGSSGSRDDAPTDLARSDATLQAAVRLVHHHDTRPPEAGLDELLSCSPANGRRRWAHRAIMRRPDEGLAAA